MNYDGLIILFEKTNFHISTVIAKATASKVDHIKIRGQDDDYAKLITDFLLKFKKRTREEIDKLTYSSSMDSCRMNAERNQKMIIRNESIINSKLWNIKTKVGIV